MDLADWALKATLPPGGICLDPFMGTGTTGIATVNRGGRFVGVDVRLDFLTHFVTWLSEGRLRPRSRKSQPNEHAPDLFDFLEPLPPDELEG